MLRGGCISLALILFDSRPPPNTPPTSFDVGLFCFVCCVLFIDFFDIPFNF